MSKEIKRTREYVEFTIVWKDRRRNNVICRLELKELRLLNQFFDDTIECFEVRIKEHYGTRDEFEQLNFG